MVDPPIVSINLKNHITVVLLMSLKIFISHLTDNKNINKCHLYDVCFLMLAIENLPFAVARTTVIILFIY